MKTFGVFIRKESTQGSIGDERCRLDDFDLILAACALTHNLTLQPTICSISKKSKD